MITACLWQRIAALHPALLIHRTDLYGSLRGSDAPCTASAISKLVFAGRIEYSPMNSLRRMLTFETTIAGGGAWRGNTHDLFSFDEKNRGVDQATGPADNERPNNICIQMLGSEWSGAHYAR